MSEEEYEDGFDAGFEDGQSSGYEEGIETEREKALKIIDKFCNNCIGLFKTDNYPDDCDCNINRLKQKIQEKANVQ